MYTITPNLHDTPAERARKRAARNQYFAAKRAARSAKARRTKKTR